jgi:GNAT superfamily N-acetyltransferase
VLPPEPLTAAHDISNFQNQDPKLVLWLQRRALENERTRASRTMVASLRGEVVGYFALAAGAIECHDVTGAIRRNMPAPIPAIILARLAVDDRHQGRGLGAFLLSHALHRGLQAGELVGARVILCHATDATARQFYLRHGFVASPTQGLTVMMDLQQAARLV